MTTIERRRLRVSPHQRDFIECPAKFDAFVGGIGSGKSMAGAIKAVGEIKKGGLGLVVCPTFRMLRDATWRTCLEVWRDRLNITNQILRGDELRVIFDNGAEALFRSAEDPERLRGPNADWFMLDEGAQCHPDTWSILIGRLRGEGRTGRGWITTTPRGMNFLYEIFVVRANADTHMHRATTADNPFLPVDYERSLRSQYDGAFARQELDAEFIADDDAALLQYAWLDAARRREAVYDPQAGPLVAGVDVAGPGEDVTVCCVRQGANILDVGAFAQADPRGSVLAFLRDHLHRGLARVNVDSAGIGFYFAEHLRDTLPSQVIVSGINVGEAPTSIANKEKYANLRAELYWGLRERFQQGDINGLTDPLMLSQLASLQYEHDSRGRVVIERKDDARKRGVKSPDYAEALMLAYATEKPGMAVARAFGGRVKTTAPTDPFLIATGNGRRSSSGTRPWGMRT